jgi:hypothetical protein
MTQEHPWVYVILTPDDLFCEVFSDRHGAEHRADEVRSYHLIETWPVRIIARRVQ